MCAGSVHVGMIVVLWCRWFHCSFIPVILDGVVVVLASVYSFSLLCRRRSSRRRALHCAHLCARVSEFEFPHSLTFFSFACVSFLLTHHTRLPGPPPPRSLRFSNIFSPLLFSIIPPLPYIPPSITPYFPHISLQWMNPQPSQLITTLTVLTST